MIKMKQVVAIKKTMKQVVVKNVLEKLIVIMKECIRGSNSYNERIR